MADEYRYQGTGRNLQKDMLGDWFQRLSQAPARGEPVAYLFISGNIAELLSNFGFHLVYPEVTALQCGIKKTAGNFILKAEELAETIRRAKAECPQPVSYTHLTLPTKRIV